jgi:integrase
MRVALETGLRINDVLTLKSGALNGTSIKYTASKTKKSGVKKISKDLAQKLKNRTVGDTYLFPGRIAGAYRTRQAVWKDIKKACELQGVKEQISPHSARKTYAVELRKKEGLPAVQKELQHSRGDVTMLYAFADLVTVNPAENEKMEKWAEIIAEKVAEKLNERKI